MTKWQEKITRREIGFRKFCLTDLFYGWKGNNLSEQIPYKWIVGGRISVEDRSSQSGGLKVTRTIGGWIRWWVPVLPFIFASPESTFCSLKCPVAIHWKCVNVDQRSEVPRAALERDVEGFERTLRKYPLNPDGTRPENVRRPTRRAELGPYETTEFICTACMKGGSCI